MGKQAQNILLLGGAGFIGIHLIEGLLDRNARITVVDNLLEQVHDKSVPKILGIPVNFLQRDCSDWNWANDPQITDTDWDAIVHLAAETGTSQSAYEAQRYSRTNIESLAILNDLYVNTEEQLRDIRKSGDFPKMSPLIGKSVIRTKRIVLLSSRAVYGDARLDDRGQPIPSAESDNPQPISIYGATKLAQEAILLSGFPKAIKVVLRLQNVYGEGQSLSNPYTGVVSAFTTRALAGVSLKVFSDGMMTRDFVHVDDVVDAILLSLDESIDQNHILNIGTGVATTILDLATMIIGATSSRSQIELTGSTFYGDIRHNYANIEKASSMGFKSKISLTAGLKRFAEWVRAEDELMPRRTFDTGTREIESRNLSK